MSEIYSPGSIAGPQGSAGAAGSQGSVSTLASSVLPQGGNLFDPSRVVLNYSVQADGTIAANANYASSGLIYCAGMTSMVMNLPASPNNATFATYDANGTFISGIDPSAFGPAFINGCRLNGGVAFPLPGTQVYVRFSWMTPWLGGYNATPDVAWGVVFATSTETAVLPAWSSFGWDTASDVNAKDAVVAANTATAIAVSAAGKNTMLRLLADSILPNPTGPGRNTLDYTKILNNTYVKADGTFATSAGMSTVKVFAPASRFGMCNLPIRVATFQSWWFALYDANGVFLETLDSTYFGTSFGVGAPGRMSPWLSFPLPGTQTYIAFCWIDADMVNANGYTSAKDQAVFLSGVTAPAITGYLPYPGNINVTIPVRTMTATELGGTAAAINAFLATASSTNPVKLILDGMFEITSSLVISPAGYTTIEGIGWGSGLTVMNDTYSVIIGTHTDAGNYNVTPPARTATHIVIRNFTVTGAGYNHISMMLSSCSNVIVENLNFPNAPALFDFMLTITNADRIKVRGCTFISVGTGRDGIHIDGLCEDITISDCYFATGDDAIALNAPEGYGGDISRVTVTNCIFDGSLTVMRAYTSIDAAHMPTNNTHKIRNVVVSNCVGHTNVQCFNIGITNGLTATLTPDQLQDFSVSNCTLSSPIGLAMLLTPIGSITFSNVRFIPTSTAAVIWAWLPIGDLVLDGVTVLRNPDGNAAPVAFVSTIGGATIDRLSLLNCRVVDEEGSSYTAVASLLDIAGTVAALRLEATDMTHITALTSGAGWGGVTKLLGTGVIGTGAAVPDSVMDNNALYLSSNASGAPSIKVGGTAKRITLV